MTRILTTFVSIDDVEREALGMLPRAVGNYYRSGADDEETLSRNRQGFKRYNCLSLFELCRVSRLLIRPFVLRDVGKLDPSVRIQLKDRNGIVCFDERLSYPLAIAPTAFQKMAHADGEEGTARGNTHLRSIIVVICSRESNGNDHD